MRTLSAPLLAAQRSKTRRPFLDVRVARRLGGIRNLIPELWENDAAPSLAPHAAATATDGSLNRLRIEGTDLYRQRVTTPSDSDDYTAWGSSVRSASRLAALAQSGTTQNLHAFTVDNNTPTQIFRAVSNDDGASWFGFNLEITHTETVAYIAADAKTGGDWVVIVQSGSQLAAYRSTGGFVTGPFVSTGTPLNITGISVYYQGDFLVVATGTDPTTGLGRIVSRTFGDGVNQASNTWSAERIIVAAGSAGVTYTAPSLSQPDTYRLTFTEWATTRYFLQQNTYCPASAEFSFNLWKEPAPTDVIVPTTHGYALTFNTTHIFITNNRRVYAVPLTTPATLDVTTDVISAVIEERKSEAGKATIVLNNAAGTYDTPAEPIAKGAEVRVSPGYYVAAGTTDTSAGPTYWVERLEHDDTVNPNTVTLHCIDALALLKRWTASRALHYPATTKNIFGILQTIAAYAGLEFSSVGSGVSAANIYPGLTVLPGTDGLTAFKRLLDRIPDDVFQRAEFLFLTEPLASDATDAEYSRNPSSTQHELTNGRYQDGLRDRPHIRVIGGATGSIGADNINHADTQRVYPGPLIVVDRELTTETLCADRAAAIARDFERAAKRDTIDAPVHCGIEILDIVEITDPRHGLTAAKRRVAGITLRYARGRSPRYDHRLILEAP